jgi:hypothetical protein
MEQGIFLTEQGIFAAEQGIGPRTNFLTIRGLLQCTVSRITTVTGGTPAPVDSTGVGDPVVEMLQKGMQSGGRLSVQRARLMEGFRYRAFMSYSHQDILRYAERQRDQSASRT